MRRLKSVTWLLVFLFLASATYSQFTKVETPGPSGVKFKSAIDNQEYVLYINVPADYATTTKRYPVLYMIDGQWSFSLTKDIYYGQLYDGLVPEIIMVGITWPDNYDANRTRDLTPTHMDNSPNSGNASQFLSVIKNEIIKYIDSTYRTDKNNNGLTGSSLGGLFALYTLFHDPGLFNRYIIGSPSLWWDNGITFNYEKNFAEKNHTLNARVFIATGEYEEAIEPTNTFNRFTDQLKASNYKGLEIQSRVLDKMGHGSIGAAAAVNSLQFIYGRPDLLLDSLVLDQYVGHYEKNVIVTRTGSLVYINFNGKTTRLHLETPERFYIMGLKGSGIFIKNDKGKVTEISFTADNNTMVFKKVI